MNPKLVPALRAFLLVLPLQFFQPRPDVPLRSTRDESLKAAHACLGANEQLHATWIADHIGFLFLGLANVQTPTAQGTGKQFSVLG
jgi:hypothetical protein